MPGGRPRKYNDKAVKQIAAKLEAYIEETDVPILAEFAYQNKIPRNTFYDYEEFSALTKRLIDKKESQLERLAMHNEIDKTMAIFSLKQLGWSDRREVTGASGGPIVVKLDKAFEDV